MFRFFSRPRPRRKTSTARKSGLRARPLAELMEDRQLLTTFPVSNLNDSGTGSLRQALLQVLSDTNNSTTSPDVISFQLSGNSLSQYRIAVQSPLPTLSRPVIIDARSLEANVPGATGPVLELDGNAAGTTAVGLQIYGQNVTVEGVAVDGFAGGGIVVNGSVTNGVGGATGVLLAYDSIGVTNADTVNANSQFGIELTSGAHYDTVQSDVIAGNQGTGLIITGSGTTSNTVSGDYIGNDTSGHWFRNSGYGIAISNGASNNYVGGTYIVDSGNTGVQLVQTSGNYFWGNDIQNNAGNGVEINGSTNNTIAASTIFANANTGVWIHSSAGASTGNVIGAAYSGGGDVISANGNWGVYISDSGSTSNVVQNDLIGTDFSGENAWGNAYNGVDIVGGAAYNTIGGTTASTRNVISGNDYNGVLIYGSYNTVEGNYIGLDASGTRALANGADGVVLGQGAYGNLIGGTSAAARNVISGNGGHGVTVTDGGTAWNTIEGDWIGTNANGNAAVGNHDGVVIVSGSTYTNVNNDVISGSVSDGVYISGNGTSFNHVYNSFIGTDSTGENVLGNGIYGVAITLGATWDYVGQDFSGNASRNLISGNGADGVYLASAGSIADYIEDNLIGVDANQWKSLGNHGNGVTVDGGATYDYVIGNTVSGNWSNGILINGGSTNDITVTYNVIGTVQGGYYLIGNVGSGIVLNGTQNDTIGGNYVWANGGWGILAEGGSGGEYVNTISGNNYGAYGSGQVNRNGDFASM